jgi:hypothetical protein
MFMAKNKLKQLSCYLIMIALSTPLITSCNPDAVEEGDYSSITNGLLTATVDGQTMYFVPSTENTNELMVTWNRTDLSWDRLQELIGNDGGLQTYTGNIIVPEQVTINGTTYRVSGIDAYAFAGNQNLDTLTIPDGITYINPRALTKSGIIKLKLPSSVTEISDGMLAGMSRLTNVSLPASVTKIDSRAFYGSTGIKSIDATACTSVTTIGDYCFYGCSALENIQLPNSIKTFGNQVFVGCSSLTSFTIPDFMEEIPAGMFNGCSNLATVAVNQGTSQLKTIRNSAFMSCKSLTSFTIPNSLTTLENRAFNGCSGLQELVIDQSNSLLSQIGDSAFYNCSSLASLTLPNALTSIGNYAFSGCNAIKTVTADQAACQLKTIGLRAFYGSSSAKMTSFILPNATTSIGAHAFQSKRSLSTINIDAVNSKLEVIADSAFYDCRALTNVILPEQLKSIASYAFYYNSKLTTLTIPASVTTLGANIFKSSGMKTLHVKWNTPIALTEDFINCGTSCKVYIPSGSLSSYQAADIWKTYTLIEE